MGLSMAFVEEINARFMFHQSATQGYSNQILSSQDPRRNQNTSHALFFAFATKKPRAINFRSKFNSGSV